MKRLTQNSAPPKQLRTLKRKVGYTEEEVSKTRAKLDKMSVDECTETTDKPGEK